ncbi:uncharacterized protein V6R79_016004 [Siganus canaliculatus]
MKMRNLLSGLILGLLAVVHSTPLPMTQEEVYREAVTDGYLINHAFPDSPTTETPRGNATVQASQESHTHSEEGEALEGSGAGESTDASFTSVFFQRGSTTASVSHVQSSTTTAAAPDADNSSSESSTTQSPQSDLTSSNGAQSSVTPDHMWFFLSTSSSTVEGSGSEEEEEETFPTVSATASVSSTEAGAASTTSAVNIIEKIVEDSEGSGSGFTDSSNLTKQTRMISINYSQPPEPEVDETHKHEPQNAGHSTPGWIIIVGFIVGVAILIILCVAIATRDKWNGPNQTSQQETKTNSSNQQRELEMETFLHKDKPRENGKAAEYTVIPLDELPEKYSSQ